MTIRHATEADIPGLLAMGQLFHEMSPHHGMGEYDKKAIARMLRFMIGNEAALVLTNGSGVIGGVMAPVYFNPSMLMMEEAFWWAKKGGRNLLKEFIAESRKMGADYVLLSTLENKMQKVVDRIVTREGFSPLERRYLKELH